MKQWYGLRNLPSWTDWHGHFFPACVRMVVTTPGGFRWDGGQFATREEAISHAEAKGYIPTKAQAIANKRRSTSDG